MTRCAECNNRAIVGVNADTENWTSVYLCREHVAQGLIDFVALYGTLTIFDPSEV